MILASTAKLREGIVSLCQTHFKPNPISINPLRTVKEPTRSHRGTRKFPGINVREECTLDQLTLSALDQNQ